jgi:acetyl esterase/lipase
VAAIGHSAGGHLAVWAAGRSKLPAGAPGAGPAVELAGAISLAGVLDLGAAAREKIGNGAGTHPGGRAVRAPRADDRVPFAESVTYVAAAQAAGQDAQLLEAGGDHFSLADITSPAWPIVINALEEMMSAP